MTTGLLSTLGLEHPIIQAPMAGANATPPALVAAVSNAGGLGFVGAAYMAPDQIAREGKRIRELTERPFGINLFVPVETSAPSTITFAITYSHTSRTAGPESVCSTGLCFETST